MSQTIRPTELEKKTAILFCCCCLGFKLYSSLLQCSGSKNGVSLVWVSIFYKSEKTERSNRLADKIIKSSAFVSYHGCLVL